MKKQRQRKILELISSRPIDTQEDLMRALQQSGFQVTQATVSRDIKELRIVKTLDSSGLYRYISNQPHAAESKVRYADIFASSVVHIDYAMNDVIIKCHSGMAPGACAALDAMKHEMVVGTLAGDDTILAVTRSEQSARELALLLSRLIAEV